MIPFGKSIQATRKSKGLTQAELAQLAGIATQYLSQIENGFAPSAFIIARMEAVLSGETVIRTKANTIATANPVPSDGCQCRRVAGIDGAPGLYECVNCGERYSATGIRGSLDSVPSLRVKRKTA